MQRCNFNFLGFYSLNLTFGRGSEVSSGYNIYIYIYINIYIYIYVERERDTRWWGPQSREPQEYSGNISVIYLPCFNYILGVAGLGLPLKRFRMERLAII